VTCVAKLQLSSDNPVSAARIAKADHAYSTLHPIVLTLGDPAGVGPEITVKAWQALRHDARFTFAVIGAADLYAGIPTQVISELAEAASVFAHALPILPLPDENSASAVSAGHPSAENAPAITGSIEQAVALALKGEAAAVVTNPISKDVLYGAGFAFPGHTEYLDALTQDRAAPYARGPVMMLSASGLSVALVTIHLALQEAIHAVRQDRITQAATVLHEALQVDFGLAAPRISMTGLNPHAGENDALGREESQIINPAAKALRARGIDISDARPADTLFHTEAREGYDAVLAMYHDQGLIPVKTLDFHGGVNITLGLPIVRTSPDHGTAFDIAGQGRARPDSLIASIKMARQIADHRAAFKARHAG